MSVTATLKGHDVFKTLTVEQVNALSGFSTSKKYKRGETVYAVGAPASHVFMLVKGLVHLRLPAGAGELSMVVSKVEPWYFLGLAPLLGGKRYSVTAQCAEDSEVLAIEVKPFRAMLQADLRVGNQVMTAVARTYSERYVELLDRLQAIVNQIPMLP